MRTRSSATSESDPKQNCLGGRCGFHRHVSPMSTTSEIHSSQQLPTESLTSFDDPIRGAQFFWVGRSVVRKAVLMARFALSENKAQEAPGRLLGFIVAQDRFILNLRYRPVSAKAACR